MKDYIQAAKEAAKKIAGEQVSIKDGACLLNVEVTGACGEKVVSGSKSLIEGEVHDSKLLSGTKLRWLPKKALSFVGARSAAVRRLLHRHGVATSNGTLVPLAKLEDIMNGLNAIHEGFEGDVDDLLEQYHDIVKRHQDENPDVATLIRRAVETPAQFSRRFKFKVAPPMAIQPLFEGEEAAIAVSAADKLLGEIAKEAGEIYRKSFSGEEHATEKKVKPVLALRDKLVNLSFLDTSVKRVALKFEEVFSKLPKSYPYVGGDFHTLCHFLVLVSDEDKVKGFAQGEDWSGDSGDIENDTDGGKNQTLAFDEPEDEAAQDVDTPAPEEKDEDPVQPSLPSASTVVQDAWEFEDNW